MKEIIEIKVQPISTWLEEAMEIYRQLWELTLNKNKNYEKLDEGFEE